MSALATLPNRTFAAVVLDLTTTKQRHALLDLTTRGRDLTDAEDALWSQLDRRRVALEDEACAMFAAETGVTWPCARAALS